MFSKAIKKRLPKQAFNLVPKRGLEPLRPKALPPQGSASTNSATWAQTYFSKLRNAQLIFSLPALTAVPVPLLEE
jgi:hypothetical protein